MLSKKIIKFSGLCGILTLIVPIITIIISIQMYPSFDWTANAISDLGTPDAASDFFNNGIVLTGVLFLLFSYGLLFFFEEREGPTIMGVSAVFLIGIGLVPLPNKEHIYMSGPFFIGIPFGFLVLGLQMRNRVEEFFRKMSLFAFIILILIAISSVTLLFFEGIAIPEILVIGPGFLWCSVFGFKMLVSK